MQDHLLIGTSTLTSLEDTIEMVMVKSPSLNAADVSKTSTTTLSHLDNEAEEMFDEH